MTTHTPVTVIAARAMAQEQARRGDHDEVVYGLQEPAIEYGHVFAVSGDLAVQPIAPRDAADMKSAEDSVPGIPQASGGGGGGGFSAAVAMETAAAYNQAVGAVRTGQASDAAAKQGIAVTQTAVPGGRVVTEFVAGQVVGQYSITEDEPPATEQEDTSKITIGEALEAAALSQEDRPIDIADAAAIQAAETQAHGADTTMPGGLADQARAAARANTNAMSDDDKIKIGDVLSDAAIKLASDKAVGMEDAARVVHAEAYRSAGARARDGGVGATVITAARLNQEEDVDDNDM